MICEHRVLTTSHITQLAFGTTRAATARMTVLYQYRAVDRFRPLAPSGSSPLHFILPAGEQAAFRTLLTWLATHVNCLDPVAAACDAVVDIRCRA